MKGNVKERVTKIIVVSKSILVPLLKHFFSPDEILFGLLFCSEHDYRMEMFMVNLCVLKPFR